MTLVLFFGCSDYVAVAADRRITDGKTLLESDRTKLMT